MIHHGALRRGAVFYACPAARAWKQSNDPALHAAAVSAAFTCYQARPSASRRGAVCRNCMYSRYATQRFTHGRCLPRLLSKPRRTFSNPRRTFVFCQHRRHSAFFYNMLRYYHVNYGRAPWFSRETKNSWLAARACAVLKADVMSPTDKARRQNVT